METAVERTTDDAFLKIEARGVEAVPPARRHGLPRHLAFLWAGAMATYASILTASLLTSFFGLGVVDGLVAVALGSAAAAVILGLLSNLGVRTGLPQVASTEGVFGDAGMRVAAFLTLFLAVGWFAVDSVIAAQDRLEPRVVLDQLRVEQLAPQRAAVDEHRAQVHARGVQPRGEARRPPSHDDDVERLAHDL